MKWTIANIWSNKPQGYSRWLRNPIRYKDSVKVNICGIEPGNARGEVGYGLTYGDLRFSLVLTHLVYGAD